jgi:tetratricopeptide (TPR) repeat protein
MSDPNESTQPIKATQPVKSQDPSPGDEILGSTQEIQPKPKKKWAGRIGKFFLNLLIFLLIIGLGVFGGYRSGIGVREEAEAELVNQQLSDQYSRAIVDIQFGNYGAAQQRLEYILEIDPSFPGVMEKLTEIMVLSSIPTVTPVVSPTPELIVDETNYEGLLVQAQQFITTQQWQNAIVVLDTLRRKDPTFHTVEVDGMYYFALRNLGVDLIQAGNLEGGIYELTLAERFAPLDNTAHALRDSARFYITAASFWELDWKLSAEYFSQLNGSGIWDGTMTATERYKIAAIRYGDQLYAEQQYCAAYEQYKGAETAGPLEEQTQGRLHQSYITCYPPTATPAPTVIATDPPATDPPATDPPPTDPPPTNTP